MISKKEIYYNRWFKEGKVGYSGMVVPETLFILNENGGRIELPIYMDEEGSFIKIKRQKKKSLSYLQS